jgi:hypothetical protein
MIPACEKDKNRPESAPTPDWTMDLSIAKNSFFSWKRTHNTSAAHYHCAIGAFLTTNSELKRSRNAKETDENGGQNTVSTEIRVSHIHDYRSRSASWFMKALWVLYNSAYWVYEIIPCWDTQERGQAEIECSFDRFAISNWSLLGQLLWRGLNRGSDWYYRWNSRTAELQGLCWRWNIRQKDYEDQ